MTKKQPHKQPHGQAPARTGRRRAGCREAERPAIGKGREKGRALGCASGGPCTPAPGAAPSSGNAPVCPVESLCGACQNVSVPYDEQLRSKQRQMEALFAPLFERRDVAASGASALLPILGMDNPYHYRNKVISPYAPGKRLPAKGGFAIRQDARGSSAAIARHGRTNVRSAGSSSRKSAGTCEILTGMYAAGTHRLVPTDTCLLENETAKAITLAVRDIMKRHGMEPYDEDAGTGFMRHAVVRVGHESGEVLVTLVTNAREFPSSKAFCRELVRRCPAVTTVVQNVNLRQTNVVLGDEERTLYGPGFILDTLCGLSFRISSKSFYQVNAVQTEVLYRTAVRMAHLTGRETAIDAYCGTGTIGLVAARGVDGEPGAARVIGVESVEQAVRDARQNARHNGVENADFVAGDAGAFMRQLAADVRAGAANIDPAHLVLFMDPPRAGSSEEFLRAAAQLAPARIVYISCNPATQVRDARLLFRQGYELTEVQPVDMFPHTDHVETVCLLSREEDK